MGEGWHLGKRRNKIRSVLTSRNQVSKSPLFSLDKGYMRESRGRMRHGSVGYLLILADHIVKGEIYMAL
jgi:hypothetical protein